jgi:hypothetical protein
MVSNLLLSGQKLTGQPIAIMNKKILGLTLGLALFGAALSASAQNVLSDLFDNNGFTTQLTAPYVGSMTLTYDGAPLAANTTYMLTDIPDYQFAISITGTDNNTYAFDNASLAAGSANLSAIEIIPLASGGFLFSNTSSNPYPGNSQGGSADFDNADGSFLTTAPPGFFSGYPDAITDGYSFYVFGNNGGETTLAMGDYGSGIEPAPEPTTLALAGLGGLSLLLIRRRK